MLYKINLIKTIFSLNIDISCGDFVDFDLRPSDLADKLTMAGFEVEEIFSTLPKFQGIIVGEVVTCEKHPDAGPI